MPTKQECVYWSKCHWKNTTFFLAATTQGLCYVSSPNTAFCELEQWVQKQLPNHQLTKMPENLSTACTQICAYLNQEQKQFSIPLDIIGTHFQQKVWKAMCEVPYGKTATYSDIANSIGNMKAVRAVASAIGANPLMIILPCHRVIAKNGTLAGYRGGIEMKKTLLTLEAN